MSSVKTRIAPSPTGTTHLGTAYVALMNYCFARSQGGQCILRIEDTDRQRSSSLYEELIIDTLKWLGISWDAGPDIGGECAPYRQSERRDIYRHYIDQLLDNGQAFYCFATSRELQQMRDEQQARGETPRYDGRGKSLTQAEIKRRIAAGEPYVVRLDVPDEGSCHLDDMLRGQISIDWSQVDMQILLKSDGMPTYHLAAAVDDHLMGITHIIRGEEWINSVPKQQLINKALGWTSPHYCHLPLLRDTGNRKLSKRRNPVGISYFRRIGILPEALLNYIARLGWSMPDEREQFSLAEMVEHFTLERISLGGPIFDERKLRWLNGEWLRSLSGEELSTRLQRWLLNGDNLRLLLPHIQPRMETFSDLWSQLGFLLTDSLNLQAEDFASCRLPLEQQREILQLTAWHIETMRHCWHRDDIFRALKLLATVGDWKLRDFLAPIFIAVTGSAKSFSIADGICLLGPDLTPIRLRQAVVALGSLSKAELETLRQRYLAVVPEGT